MRSNNRLPKPIRFWVVASPGGYMRQQRRQAIFIVVMLLCVTAGPVVGKFRGGRPTSTSTQEQIDTSNFPIVDVTTTLPTDPNEQAKRNRKNKKYNSRYAPPLRELDQIYTFTA